MNNIYFCKWEYLSVEETKQDKTGRRGEDIVHTIMHAEWEETNENEQNPIWFVLCLLNM